MSTPPITPSPGSLGPVGGRERHCSNTSYTSQSSCLSHSKTWTPDSHSTWNGCVTDRDQNFDTTNDAPLAGSTLYPAEQYSSCPAAVMGLSNDWTALSNKIDAMQPDGNTNQAIGLQMGWQSLDGGARSPCRRWTRTTSTQQVIILLTDGLNTAGPLVQQRLLDRHAAAEDLRQYQGRGHHALYRAGQHRRRSDLDAAAELRERCQQVLPADLVQADRHDLQPDRHRALQSAAGDVTWSGQERKPSVNDVE